MVTGVEECEAIEQIAAQAGEFDDVFPRTYVASWKVTGLQRFPGPSGTCRSCLPITTAAFRLVVRDKRFGYFSLSLNTYDGLGNFPGNNLVTLASEVAVQPGSVVHMVEGRSSSNFYRATYEPIAQLEASFSAAWTATGSGGVCYSGSNTFRRTFALTRVALHHDGDGFRFE